MRTLKRKLVVAFVIGMGLSSCHKTNSVPVVQPVAPGTASRVITSSQAVDLSKVQATKADIAFMQAMIHHHLQAIDMTALLEQNTQSEDMRKLGLRMSLSQSDEIKMMRHWLEVRGQEA